MELFVTDCFLNNLLYELYFGGDLEVSISNKLTTTTTAGRIIGTSLFTSGFDKGMPCIYTIFANTTAPLVTLNPYGSVLKANFDLQMECQKNANDTAYY